jgi:hypothetical protein
METSATVSRINGTESTCPLVLDEDTILATNDLGNQFPLPVRINNPFGFNLLSGFWGKVVMYHFIGFLKETHFLHRDRSARIAFYAAGTMTFLQVATEEHLEEVKRNKGVEDFKHRS